MDKELVIAEEYYKIACKYRDQLKLMLDPVKSRKHLFHRRVKSKFNTLVPKVEANLSELITIFAKILAELNSIRSLESIILSDEQKIVELQHQFNSKFDAVDELNLKIQPVRDKCDKQYENIKFQLIQHKEEKTKLDKELHTKRNIVRDKIKNFTPLNKNIHELKELKEIIYEKSKSNNWDTKPISYESCRSNNWNLNLDTSLIINQLTDSEKEAFILLLDDFFGLEQKLIENKVQILDTPLDELCYDFMEFSYNFGFDRNFISEDESEQLAQFNEQYTVLNKEMDMRKQELNMIIQDHENKVARRDKMVNKLKGLKNKAEPLKIICVNDRHEITAFINSLPK